MGYYLLATKRILIVTLWPHQGAPKGLSLYCKLQMFLCRLLPRSHAQRYPQKSRARENAADMPSPHQQHHRDHCREKREGEGGALLGHQAGQPAGEAKARVSPWSPSDSQSRISAWSGPTGSGMLQAKSVLLIYAVTLASVPQGGELVSRAEEKE